MMVSWKCPWCGEGPQAVYIENPERLGVQPMILAHCDVDTGGCDTASAISVKISAQVDVHAIELQPHQGKARMPRGDFPDNWSSAEEDPV